MKLWIDDVRPAPNGYILCKTPIDHLGVPKEDFEKHLKQTENANNLAELMKITNLIDSY